MKFSEKTFAPSLLNADGTFIAAMCKASAGKKWGYIEVVTSISTDGGESWSEEQTVAAPPARAISSDIANTKSAFFAKPTLARAKDGTVLLLVTFFPESKGTADMKYLEKKKTAFTLFDGVKCPIIYDKEGNYYIVWENGSVIDKRKAQTAFYIEDIGELYRDDEYMGNIYLNGAQGKSETGGKTTFGSRFKAPKRSYLFLLKSDDNGRSWSRPVDITPSVLNEKDTAFIGTCGGAALTTQSGRIIVPMMSDKGNFSIYSDDNGQTWCRNQRQQYTGASGEWTAFEAPNGHLYGYAEGKALLSADNGILWMKGDKPAIKLPKQQKSAATCGDTLLLAYPLSTSGIGGAVATAAFEYDKHNAFKGIRWHKNAVIVTDDTFLSPCLAVTEDGEAAVLYEGDNGVVFTTVTY